MNELTKRQGEILEFLGRYLNENGYPPTIREIKGAFNLSSNRGVIDHLRALERKGHIKRIRGISRAIEILSPHAVERIPVELPGGAMSYPLAGRIEAGRPALPIEDCRESIILGKDLFCEPGDFILEVSGDSMVEEHIVPGDLVVVRRSGSCRSGDIVVAMVDGEATVKRYVERVNAIVLEPANSRHEPIVFKGDDLRLCTILGKVIGVIRRIAATKRPFSG
jgi:repressor LexA